MSSSGFDDPAVVVTEDEADKETLERQEDSFNYVEDLRNVDVICSKSKLILFLDCGWQDLHNMEVLGEDQGGFHQGC